MDLTCMGELFLDMFAGETGVPISKVKSFLPTPGGAAANVAVQASRLGIKAAFIGKVGDEAFGHHLSGVLKEEGVDVRGVRFDPFARTTTNFIALPDPNSAEFLFYRNPGADMMLKSAELDVELIRQSKAFYFGSLGLIDEPLRSTQLEAIKLARENGCLIFFDANYRAPLWKNVTQARKAMQDVLPLVNVIKVNEIELEVLTGSKSSCEEDSKKLLDCGLDLVVVTLGSDGSFFQCAKGTGKVPGFKVITEDASGCGDSFVAGLLVQLLSIPKWKDNLEPVRLSEILLFANACGAITSTKKGVIPILPSLTSVNDFIESYQD